MFIWVTYVQETMSFSLLNTVKRFAKRRDLLCAHELRIKISFFFCGIKFGVRVSIKQTKFLTFLTRNGLDVT